MAYRIHLERDELEGRLGGGLPEGALVVLEGEYGSGKSLIMERLVYGFLHNGLRVSVVSTELTTLHFVEQMHSLDYPVEEFLLDKRLLFLPVYPILAHRGKKVDLIDRMLRARTMYEQDVIVVDAFSTLLSQWIRAVRDAGIDPSAGLEEVLYRFKLLANRGRTIILTIEPSEVPPEIVQALRSTADVYFSLRTDTSGGTVSRHLLVRRFGRAEKAVTDLIPYRVEPGAGLIVEIRSVS